MRPGLDRFSTMCLNRRRHGSCRLANATGLRRQTGPRIGRWRRRSRFDWWLCSSVSNRSRSGQTSLPQHSRLNKLLDVGAAANAEVGAKTAETSGMEYLVRGKGFLGSGKTEEETIEQIENTVVTNDRRRSDSSSRSGNRPNRPGFPNGQPWT